VIYRTPPTQQRGWPVSSYTGSGPYCYVNSLAMMLGEASPPPGVIAVLTGSPFGFVLLGGTLPLFDRMARRQRSGWTQPSSCSAGPADAATATTLTRRWRG
jgi:hypothetical protein